MPELSEVHALHCRSCGSKQEIQRTGQYRNGNYWAALVCGHYAFPKRLVVAGFNDEGSK